VALATRLTPEPTPPPTTVRLDLTEDEAKTLRTIFHLIGGNPDTSLRKHTDAMDAALRAQAEVGCFPTYEGGRPTVIDTARGRAIFFRDGTL
jgi:hypothetical protein